MPKKSIKKPQIKKSSKPRKAASKSASKKATPVAALSSKADKQLAKAESAVSKAESAVSKQNDVIKAAKSKYSSAKPRSVQKGKAKERLDAANAKLSTLKQAYSEAVKSLKIEKINTKVSAAETAIASEKATFEASLKEKRGVQLSAAIDKFTDTWNKSQDKKDAKAVKAFEQKGKAKVAKAKASAKAAIKKVNAPKPKVKAKSKTKKTK